MSYYSKALSADVGSIQIFCRIRLTENIRWINIWVLIEIINTNRNREKIMRSLFLASTSWLKNVCYFKSQRNNKCKNWIKMKNVNVQLSFLIKDTWAGGKVVSCDPNTISMLTFTCCNVKYDVIKKILTWRWMVARFVFIVEL